MKKKLGLALSALIIITITLNASLGTALDRSDVEVAVVSSEDLVITASGFGTLVSLDEESLTSDFSGTITSIKKYGGNFVSEGDVILTLENRSLERDLINSQDDLEQAEVAYKKLELELEQEVVKLENQLIDAGYDIEIAKLEFEANTELFNKSIVSKTTYLQSQIVLKKAENVRETLKRELQSKKENKKKKLEIESIFVKQKQRIVESRVNDLNKLVVRAPRSGVLLGLSFNVGESVQENQLLAIVGDELPKSVKVKFPASTSKHLDNGKKITVKYLGESKIARIIRIDPKSENGYVIAYANIETTPFADSKVDASVTTSLEVETITNEIWAQRPVGIGNSQKIASVFVVGDNKESAQKQEVTIKRVVSNFIIVEQGLKDKDRIIVSDTSHVNAEQVNLN